MVAAHGFGLPGCQKPLVIEIFVILNKRNVMTTKITLAAGKYCFFVITTCREEQELLVGVLLLICVVPT